MNKKIILDMKSTNDEIIDNELLIKYYICKKCDKVAIKKLKGIEKLAAFFKGTGNFYYNDNNMENSECKCGK